MAKVMGAKDPAGGPEATAGALTDAKEGSWLENGVVKSTGYNIRNYGATPGKDAVAAIQAADAAALAAPDGVVVVPQGNWDLESDLTLVSPVRSDGSLRPAAGKTLQFDAPFASTGRKSLDVGRGGIVRFGATAGQEIDARYFGAIPGQGETKAAATAAALNELFACWRASTFNVDHEDFVTTLRLAPGDYAVSESIWAGAPGGKELPKSGYTFRAENARLVATPNLTDRVVFDMTGARRARVYGLNIGAKGTEEEAPRIGMLLSRLQKHGGGGESCGICYLESVRIDGHFKIAAILQSGSEVDVLLNCDFHNRCKHTPSWALVNQGLPHFDTKSEHARTWTEGDTTNVSHYYRGCRFDSGYQGEDRSVGGHVCIHQSLITSFQQCYFNGSTKGSNAIRVHGGNTRMLTIKDCQFERAWWASYVLLSGSLDGLTIEDSGGSLDADGAVVRMTKGATLNQPYLRPFEEGTIRVPESTTFVIDGHEENCSVEDATIISRRCTEVSGRFTGTIQTPSFSNVSLTGPLDSVHAHVFATRTGAGRSVDASDSTVKLVTADYTLAAGDTGARIRTREDNATNFTITIPDPDRFGLGTWFEITNGGSGLLTLAYAVNEHGLRLYNGTVPVPRGPIKILPGEAIRACKVADAVWDSILLTPAAAKQHKES